MMHIKSTKDFDEDFKRAQKPWAKLYVKVDKYKREYHTATKNLKMAEAQENNAKLDGAIPQDQRAKVAEKVERCRKEKETAKCKYTEALQELNRSNPKYMDDMNEVFTRCQVFERDRLAKFREFLGATEKCLDLTHRLQPSVFQQFSQTIKNCDPDRDLSWWSDTYGATMKMNWPIFEEPTDLVNHFQHVQQQATQSNRFSYAGDSTCNYDACHRRPLAHFVSQTSAAVLVVDSYATIRRSMRRTAAVVTRVRRDRIKREEYSDAQRTLSRRKGDLERENPVIVTAIRSSQNGGSTNMSSSDIRQSTNYVNQSPVPPIRSAQPFMYPSLTTSNIGSANPFGDDDDDDDDNNNHNRRESATTNRSNHTSGTNNNGFSNVPPYPTNNIQSSYPASANPFLDDDDNIDSLSPSHQTSHQSPTSTGGSSLDSSAGAPVRALYDYEAQEQDELSFKQGDIFTKLEDEDDQGWCKGRVGGRIGLYPATYVESL
ncbi:unnamed protein product [Adineta ricciae]|uniref:Uncharacterized protein n=1 Tax=Adineta ricciae TaxID=249248 RepID=A0A816FMF0_ADIRI|nr:unnamed protein product [Adineta ricciae]